jgi:mannose-1-phosphate guanylyltransferase
MTKESVQKGPAIIIMAGGMGMRFWPASRENTPKQFLSICGDRSLVEECFLRVSPLTDPKRILVVVNVHHNALARTILGETGAQIVEEPYGRNTAPCIALGCIHVMKTFGDIPIIALPADHYISGEPEFRRCLVRGLSLVRDGSIVTVGIKPTSPETGYGYIEKGPPLGKGEACHVSRFVEKPDSEAARGFVTSEKYLWNAGIFLFKPSTMLGEFQTHLPRMHEEFDRISGAFETEDFPSIIEETYREMESISIDYGVMEKTDRAVSVVEGDFGWSDVGSWTALRELRRSQQDSNGNVVAGKIVLHETKDCFIHAQGGKMVAMLGLENVLVVDTEDVLFVADLNRSQEVRRFPEVLKKKGWTEYL